MSAPRSPNLPGPDEWPTWTLIERERLEVAHDERPFLEGAASLVTEFGELASLLVRAWAPPSAVAASARNEAILCALAVRIVKLTRRLVAETYEHRAELQLLLDREIFVSTAAMAYLLRGGGDRFEAFVRDGLRADRAVWRHLDGNRELRDGEALPMEQRMRERLARSFELAGVDPDEPEADESGWPSLASSWRRSASRTRTACTSSARTASTASGTSCTRITCAPASRASATSNRGWSGRRRRCSRSRPSRSRRAA